MNEVGFANDNPENGRQESENLESEMRILSDVARQHLDDLLSAEDWKQFGLDRVNPQDLEDFQWSVYVKEYDGRKYIGVKILDENGLYDVREFVAADQSLPVSTKQQAIADEIVRRSETQRISREKEKAELRAKMEQERGFPDGEYALFVMYPHRSGEKKTNKIGNISVEMKETKEAVFRDAKSWVSMAGLHNFGLDTSRGNGASVQVLLKNENGTEVNFECRVDSSGHIMPENK